MQMSSIFNELLNTVRSEIVSKESDIVHALFMSLRITV